MLKRIFNYIILKGSEINAEHFSYILGFKFEIKRFLKKKKTSIMCNQMMMLNKKYLKLFSK